MARFRNRFRTSETLLQLCFILFIVSMSFGVLFLVMEAKDEVVCDYTDLVESCDLQPVYRTEEQKNWAMQNFDVAWQQAAQDKRREAEEQKCDAEKRLMDDLTAMHRKEADRIIRQCMKRFQTCVDNLALTTTTTTITTTQYVYVKSTTKDLESRCRQVADASFKDSGGSSTLATGTYMDCITGGEANFAAQLAAAAKRAKNEAPVDCTRCDKFCSAYNWTQQFPEMATAMNFTGRCTAKVCPWIPECTDGTASVMQLHKNCTQCPCYRANCIAPFVGQTFTPTTTQPPGGRRLARHTAAPSPASTSSPPPPTTSFIPWYSTSTTENLVNTTQCTCKPGLVDTVHVGRPFRVFYNVETRRRRRTVPSGGGRRLIFEDEDASIDYTQGVHIEMEEEIIEDRERVFDCRDYFSDRYKYVYPKSLGDPESLEALMARQAHPDLGCGYSGTFKVMCTHDPPEDNTTEWDGPGNCSYKVDISTCKPPNYQESVDSCYVEENAAAAQTVYMPKVADFLGFTEFHQNVSKPAASNELDFSTVTEDCCEPHVGSECVQDINHNGSWNGTWQPKWAYEGKSAYFPIIACSQQAKITRRMCPRVDVVRLEDKAYHADQYELECSEACNLTWARQELQKVCDNTAFPATEAREKKALREKVSWMTWKRNELEGWSRANFPLVTKTTHVHDCIADMHRRYNSLGQMAQGSGFDKLRLRYECRMHGCNVNQCVKISRPCPIPRMSSPPELTCGPFGDENTYECVDKVYISSQGLYSSQIAYGFFGLGGLFLIVTCLACFQVFCLKQEKVVPIIVEDEFDQYCEECEGVIDPEALESGSLICTDCILKSKLPEACRNCGAEFEDPEDLYCPSCRAPRDNHKAALMDAEAQVCRQCGEPMGEDDGKCNECGWHPDDAIVVRAEMSPLRANAASAANEDRIVPVDLEPLGGRPNVTGHE